MATRTIEQRLQALEDYHEIANLKAAYLNAADGGWDRESHDAELMASFFTEDAYWHSESHDRADGRDGIIAKFATFRAALPFAYHVITNPKITVDGDKADAEWHVTWIGTDASGSELWAAGIYKDKLARTPQGWRFQSVYCRLAYFGPYDEGWARSMGIGKTLGSGTRSKQAHVGAA
jgi:ketosteroid isomerase-like protein